MLCRAPQLVKEYDDDDDDEEDTATLSDEFCHFFSLSVNFCCEYAVQHCRTYDH